MMDSATTPAPFLTCFLKQFMLGLFMRKSPGFQPEFYLCVWRLCARFPGRYQQVMLKGMPEAAMAVQAAAKSFSSRWSVKKAPFLKP